MEYIFVASLFLVFHAYFGYPLSLFLLGCFRKLTIRKASIEPTVTLIITVCNEERRIREKMENTIAIDYPREKLQVFVASDGSTDRTNEIIMEFTPHGIELLAFTDRRGKENAQKDAVALAKGEIIVFSDVSTSLEPLGLREIVANFADQLVGCVSSVDRVIGRDGKPCGEGFYVKYEMWLRDMESQINSLVGMSGSFFAARSEVCQNFSGDMQSDFRTVLNSLKLGLRGVSDPASVGIYQDVADNKREFERKVRTVLRGMTVFFRNLEFLNIFKYGLFSYQYFCHKLLRWMVPFFLTIALVANIALAIESNFFLLLLLVQGLFYGVAIFGNLRTDPPSHVAIKIPMYFVNVNAAIIVAWWRYLTGDRMVMWAPTKR